MRINELQFHSSFSISASCMTQSLTCVCAVQDKYNGLSFTMERPRGCPCPFLCWPFNCTIINPLKMFVRSTDGKRSHPACNTAPELWLRFGRTCRVHQQNWQSLCKHQPQYACPVIAAFDTCICCKVLGNDRLRLISRLAGSIDMTTSASTYWHVQSVVVAKLA